MLTIAGSGMNIYSFSELSCKVELDEFDCILADINFDNSTNRELIPEQVEQKYLPFKEIRAIIKKKILENKKVLYVVTGSPFYFSAMQDILRFLDQELQDFRVDDVEIIPAQSSKDYLVNKLRLSENELVSLSLHGRKLLDLTKFLSTKYTFVLCDELSIEKIARETKYISSKLKFYLGAKLGSKNELIKEVDLQQLSAEMSAEQIKQTLSPYVLLVERNFEADDSALNNDFATRAGMITKADKRALTLQALELKPNIQMWDIGAGSGSISIDAYKLFKTRTVLFEKNSEQCSYTKNNLFNHNIVAAELIEGEFNPDENSFPSPDRIFIGGGGESVMRMLPELYAKLSRNGVLVANIIGLENLSVAVTVLKDSSVNYKTRSIDISNYRKITGDSSLTIPEPQRTLFQIIMRKENE